MLASLIVVVKDRICKIDVHNSLVVSEANIVAQAGYVKYIIPINRPSNRANPQPMKSIQVIASLGRVNSHTRRKTFLL